MHVLSLIVLSLSAIPSLALTPKPGCSTPSTSTTARKIAIVIDSSGSNHNENTDPDDLRIVAGRALASLLSPKDRVAVIDFDYSATVISPLGPPSSASFDGIDAVGGTNIGAGLEAALEELAKGGNTAGRSGIVLLTDGGSSTLAILDQLEAAEAAGVRVVYGHLEAPPPAVADVPDASVVAAVKKTGGMYAGINNDQAQRNFVNAAVAHGLTAADGRSKAGNVLFPGLLTPAGLDTGKVEFTYDAFKDERLNFTIAVNPAPTEDVKCALSTEGGKTVKEVTTDNEGVAGIQYTVGPATGLKLQCSGPKDEDTQVSVLLGSNVPRNEICGAANSTNTTTGGSDTNTTTTTNTTNGTSYPVPSGPVPSGPKTPIYTGAAATVAARQSWVNIGLLGLGMAAFAFVL